MKTLIVEDQLLFRDLLLRASRMNPDSNNVLGVATAAAAENALNQSEFDLVILDIELPDRNGIEFADWISKPSCSR